MNRCGYQQLQTAFGVSEERRMLMVDSVVCPKPRRLGLLNPSINDQLRPLRMSTNCTQTAEIGGEMGDSGTGSELLDIILRKGRCGVEATGYQVALSPPFYSGSPPSRVSNPVIQDAHFGNEGITSISPASPSPSSRLGGSGAGCVRMKFGPKPAAVRIEGFDCLSRDRRNCSISAVA